MFTCFLQHTKIGLSDNDFTVNPGRDVNLAATCSVGSYGEQYYLCIMRVPYSFNTFRRCQNVSAYRFLSSKLENRVRSVKTRPAIIRAVEFCFSRVRENTSDKNHSTRSPRYTMELISHGRTSLARFRTHLYGL